MINVIYDLMDRLLNNAGLCTLECASFLLGTLLRSLNDNGMTLERPKEPYDGISVAALVTAVDSAVDPYKVVGHDGQIRRIMCLPRMRGHSSSGMEPFSCNVRVLMRDIEMHLFQEEEMLHLSC